MEAPKAKLSYIYKVGDESQRQNFHQVCTHCGKIFETNTREEAEFIRKAFKYCFGCGAEFEVTADEP